MSLTMENDRFSVNPQFTQEQRMGYQKTPRPPLPSLCARLLNNFPLGSFPVPVVRIGCPKAPIRRTSGEPIVFSHWTHVGPLYSLILLLRWPVKEFPGKHPEVGWDHSCPVSGSGTAPSRLWDSRYWIHHSTGSANGRTFVSVRTIRSRGDEVGPTHFLASVLLTLDQGAESGIPVGFVIL